jgi:hypothetical protein
MNFYVKIIDDDDLVHCLGGKAAWVIILYIVTTDGSW